MNELTTTFIGETAEPSRSAERFSDRLAPLARDMEVEGGHIRYAMAGDGPALLLFHGIPLSMTSWQDLFFLLAGDFRVIAIDMPGFGQSGKTFGDYSLDAICARVVELCDKLGVERTHVAGSSFGAAVATTLALNAPSLVDRLLLVNSVGIAGGTHAVERMARIGLMRYVVRNALLRDSLGRGIFRSKLRASYAVLEPDEALVSHYYDLLRQPHAAECFLQTLQQFREADLQARLGTLDKPVLSIWGTEDRVLPVQKSVGIQRRLGDCWSVIVQGAGHMPHEEFPERCAALFRRFLSLRSA